MAIRKFGTEPAKVETRVEDNDLETLGQVRKQAEAHQYPCGLEDCLTCRQIRKQ